MRRSSATDWWCKCLQTIERHSLQLKCCILRVSRLGGSRSSGWRFSTPRLRHRKVGTSKSSLACEGTWKRSSSLRIFLRFDRDGVVRSASLSGKETRAHARFVNAGDSQRSVCMMGAGTSSSSTHRKPRFARFWRTTRMRGIAQFLSVGINLFTRIPRE